MIRRGRNRRSRNLIMAGTVRWTGPGCGYRGPWSRCIGVAGAVPPMGRGHVAMESQAARAAACRRLVAGRRRMSASHPTKETPWTHSTAAAAASSPACGWPASPSRSPSRSVPARRRPPRPRPAGTSTTPTVAPADSQRPRRLRRRRTVVGRLPGPRATKAAIAALATLDVKTAGADGVKAAITTVRTSLDTLKASAGAELAPAVTGVTTALDSLQTTVEGANGDMSSAAAPIAQALLGVAAAVTVLEASAKSACG